MNCFQSLRWKKFEPEKYAKQQDKDCIAIATYIMKALRGETGSKTKIAPKSSTKFDQIFDDVNITQSEINRSQLPDEGNQEKLREL